MDLDKKYIFDDVNGSENPPRAQVIGAQEIYRDPRQERLKHIKKNPVEDVSEIFRYFSTIYDKTSLHFTLRCDFTSCKA